MDSNRYLNKNGLKILLQKLYKQNETPQHLKTKSPVGTMNIILVIVAVVLLVFTSAMIYIYINYGSIPDTLCTCVFAVLGGECGAMAWIKSAKEKYKEREWQKEDSKTKREDDMN